MNLETLHALLQLGRFAMDAADRYSRGEMTDEEVAAEWQEIRDRLAGANAMWERAGQ